MNYIINSKNRKFKYKLHLLVESFSFNFLNFTLSQKIVFFGVIIAFISLFFPWFTINYDRIIINNGFSINSGYVGYLIFIISAFLLFILFSNKNKEKIKSKANVIFHDYTLIIFAGIIILLLSFTIFNTIKGLTTFFKAIEINNGIVCEIIGGIFIFIGGILNYREKKQEILSKIYIENANFQVEKDMEEYSEILNPSQTNNSSNMKLPI